MQEEIKYSEEVQEIMGRVPHWVTRVGIGFIFAFVVLLILGSYFFRYPEIVSAKVMLTTINSPAPLVSQATGRISTWFVSDGQFVVKGVKIAQLESTTNPEDVEIVARSLNSLQGNWEEDVMKIILPSQMKLGSLQNSFSSFYKSFEELKSYLKNDVTKERISLKEKQIALARKQYNQLVDQRVLKQNRFNISKRLYSTDSLFFKQNTFGVPKREYDISEQNFIQEKESLLAFENTIETMESNILQMEEILLDLKARRQETLSNISNTLTENFKSLNNELHTWRQAYQLVAPIDGKITMTKFWSSNQVINNGERLATVIPNDKTLIIGKAFITSASLGKVERGQVVNIKLSGFPYTRYGVLKGTVKTISLIPEDNNYIAEIELTQGMTSDYSEKLKFVHEMDGVAEIVTKDIRLIDRFFEGLRFSN